MFGTTSSHFGVISLTILCGFLLWQAMGWKLYAHSCPLCGTKNDEHDKDCPWA